MLQLESLSCHSGEDVIISSHKNVPDSVSNSEGGGTLPSHSYPSPLSQQVQSFHCSVFFQFDLFPMSIDTIVKPLAVVPRHYVAEGVRLYCQETWKLVTEMKGVQLVEKYIHCTGIVYRPNYGTISMVQN